MSNKKPLKSRKSSNLCHKIKVAMTDQELTRMDIARELNVGCSAITNVLNGHSKSKRILNHLITKLGMK